MSYTKNQVVSAISSAQWEEAAKILDMSVADAQALALKGLEDLNPLALPQMVKKEESVEGACRHFAIDLEVIPQVFTIRLRLKVCSGPDWSVTGTVQFVIRGNGLPVVGIRLDRNNTMHKLGINLGFAGAEIEIGIRGYNPMCVYVKGKAWFFHHRAEFDEIIVCF